ncbi:MAG: flagellar basal body P-ring formation chaperone FlgA [Spirochaetia bacterium]|nr:flagellar basal body P-ring formation chaperone FlgA [Spirochaetia bacterium]
MNFLNKKLLFFITAHLLIFLSGDVLFSWHYFLKKKIFISEAEIKAGDMGNIYGTDLTRQQKIEIQESVIAENPLQNTRWTSDDIRSFLSKKNYYPESIRGTEVQLIIPSKEYSIEEIQNVIQSAYSGALSHDYKVVVKNPVNLPESFKYKIKLDSQKSPGEKVAFFVYSLASGEKSIKVIYTLLKNYTLIESTADLKYGERLTSQNIQKKSMWLDHPVDSVFLEMPLGYTTLLKIEKGSLIMPSDVIKKIDVKNGDLLTLEYNGKNILIQTSVRACESGSIGETIKFRTSKNKILFGEIISRNKANFTKPNSEAEKLL